MYLQHDGLSQMAGSAIALYRGLNVALVVPCFNEALAIAEVVDRFRAQLPELDIHVFDNHSDDETVEIALSHGAMVHRVSLRGKGNVVRRMFADVDADVYVMVDGDGTYDASSVRVLVDRLIDERLDMVVGCRETAVAEVRAAYRPGHQWGNRLLTESVRRIFGGGFSDMLSGYRVLSKRYVKTFPAASKGFEIETELTVHALELRMPCAEELTSYGSRRNGSNSKLSTYRDGLRIIYTIFWLYVSERPLAFFSLCSLGLASLSIGLAIPVFIEFFEHGVVPRLPTAVLSASCMLMAMLALLAGLILDNVTRGRQEFKRLMYLAIGRQHGSGGFHR